MDPPDDARVLTTTRPRQHNNEHLATRNIFLLIIPSRVKHRIAPLVKGCWKTRNAQERNGMEPEMMSNMDVDAGYALENWC